MDAGAKYKVPALLVQPSAVGLHPGWHAEPRCKGGFNLAPSLMNQGHRAGKSSWPQVIDAWIDCPEYLPIKDT